MVFNLFFTSKFFGKYTPSNKPLMLKKCYLSFDSKSAKLNLSSEEWSDYVSAADFNASLNYCREYWRFKEKNFKIEDFDRVYTNHVTPPFYSHSSPFYLEHNRQLNAERSFKECMTLNSKIESVEEVFTKEKDFIPIDIGVEEFASFLRDYFYNFTDPEFLLLFFKANVVIIGFFMFSSVIYRYVEVYFEKIAPNEHLRNAFWYEVREFFGCVGVIAICAKIISML